MTPPIQSAEPWPEGVSAASRVINALYRRHARRIAVFSGPNSKSEFELWSGANGTVLVQCYKGGGVEVYIPIDEAYIPIDPGVDILPTLLKLDAYLTASP